MNIYEMYGRLSEAKVSTDNAFKLTLDLLKQLKAGEINPNHLVVSDTSWYIEEPDETA